MFKELKHFGCIIFANHNPSYDLGISHPEVLAEGWAYLPYQISNMTKGLALTASPAARPQMWDLCSAWQMYPPSMA